MRIRSRSSSFRSTHVAIVLSLAVLAACGADAPRERPPESRTTAAAPESLTTLAPLDTAEGCRQTSGTRPDTAIRPGDAGTDAWQRAFARGAAFRCAIHPSLRDVGVTLLGDSVDASLDSMIVVLDARAGRERQVLPIGPETEMPEPWRTEILHAVDLDADGYRDLLLGSAFGATGNTLYHVWRFDPRSRRFAEDSVLSVESNPVPVPGRPCVWTSSNSSAADYGTTLLCLADGRWRPDSAVTNRWDRRTHEIVHEVWARRGGTLAVVQRRASPDSLPPDE